MFDFYLSLEQERREQQDLDAVYEDGDRAADGRWDGLIGADPKLPQDLRYWEAYCDALRGVWLKKLCIELEEVALSEVSSDKSLATVEEF